MKALPLCAGERQVNLIGNEFCEVRLISFILYGNGDKKTNFQNKKLDGSVLEFNQLHCRTQECSARRTKLFAKSFMSDHIYNFLTKKLFFDTGKYVLFHVVFDSLLINLS